MGASCALCHHLTDEKGTAWCENLSVPGNSAQSEWIKRHQEEHEKLGKRLQGLVQDSWKAATGEDAKVDKSRRIEEAGPGACDTWEEAYARRARLEAWALKDETKA